MNLFRLSISMFIKTKHISVKWKLLLRISSIEMRISLSFTWDRFIRVHEIFFTQVGHYYIRLNFGRGEGSIFPGEFSDIIAFLLPNIFGKPRKRVVHLGGSTFRRWVRPSILGGRPPPVPTPHAHAWTVLSFDKAIFFMKIFNLHVSISPTVWRSTILSGKLHPWEITSTCLSKFILIKPRVVSRKIILFSWILNEWFLKECHVWGLTVMHLFCEIEQW